MIRTDSVVIHDREYIHTWSDAGRYIIRNDGTVFVEAVDPIEFEYSYVEGDVRPSGDEKAQELLNIILGGNDE